MIDVKIDGKEIMVREAGGTLPTFLSDTFGFISAVHRMLSEDDEFIAYMYKAVVIKAIETAFMNEEEVKKEVGDVKERRKKVQAEMDKLMAILNQKKPTEDILNDLLKDNSNDLIKELKEIKAKENE